MTRYDEKILLVEDDEIAREVLVLILSKHFKTVLTAANGKEGIQKYSENAPDLILLDLAMPVLDGFSMITEMEKTYPDAKILIITAYREEAEKCEGYQIIHKPIEKKELLGAISGILNLQIQV